MALAFAVSLLLVAAVVVTFMLVKALITGKKASPAMVFGRFRAYGPQAMWPGKAKPAGAVVDVSVREMQGDNIDLQATTGTRTTAPKLTAGRFATPRNASAMKDVADVTDVTDKKATRPADSAA